MIARSMRGRPATGALISRPVSSARMTWWLRSVRYSRPTSLPWRAALLPVDVAQVHAGLEVLQRVEVRALAGVESAAWRPAARRGRTGAAPAPSRRPCPGVIGDRRLRRLLALQPDQAQRPAPARPDALEPALAAAQRRQRRTRASAAAAVQRARPGGRASAVSRSLTPTRQLHLARAAAARRRRSTRAVSRPARRPAPAAPPAARVSRARRGGQQHVGQHQAQRPARSTPPPPSTAPGAASADGQRHAARRRPSARSRGGWGRGASQLTAAPRPGRPGPG